MTETSNLIASFTATVMSSTDSTDTPTKVTVLPIDLSLHALCALSLFTMYSTTNVQLSPFSGYDDNSF